MEHSESFMTSHKRQGVVNVRLRAAKVRFSQILEHQVHCITFAKERKKKKKVTLGSCFYTTTTLL